MPLYISELGSLITEQYDWETVSYRLAFATRYWSLMIQQDEKEESEKATTAALSEILNSKAKCLRDMKKMVNQALYYEGDDGSEDARNGAEQASNSYIEAKGTLGNRDHSGVFVGTHPSIVHSIADCARDLRAILRSRRAGRLGVRKRFGLHRGPLPRIKRNRQREGDGGLGDILGRGPTLAPEGVRSYRNRRPKSCKYLRVQCRHVHKVSHRQNELITDGFRRPVSWRATRQRGTSGVNSLQPSQLLMLFLRLPLVNTGPAKRNPFGPGCLNLHFPLSTVRFQNICRLLCIRCYVAFQMTPGEDLAGDDNSTRHPRRPGWCACEETNQLHSLCDCSVIC